MNTDRYRSTDRHYRRAVTPARGETAFQVVVEQSDLFITARADLSHEVGAFLHSLRGPLKAWIGLHPEFASSLVPVDVPDSAPPICRGMAQAAKLCNVGPMAAVAGATAQAVADHFKDQSPDIIVENGGDVFMHSTRARTAALLADPEGGPSLGLNLPASAFPLALCASSARIGHSLSLGHGDLAVVLAHTGALADAAATAICNMLDTPKDLNKATKAAQALKPHGVRGLFAQCGEKIAAWGDIELVALD